MEALEREIRSFLIPSLSILCPTCIYFPLNGSLSFWKDIGVHKDGGVVVADAWSWLIRIC